MKIRWARLQNIIIANAQWVALHLRTVTIDRPPFSVPRYLHMDLGRQTQRSVARFRLHSHTLRVETRSWEHHDGTCDECGLQAIQDEKHALFLCRCKLPLKPSNVRGPPHVLPRCLELELSRHALRNIARFRLRAHTL